MLYSAIYLRDSTIMSRDPFSDILQLTNAESLTTGGFSAGGSSEQIRSYGDSSPAAPWLRRYMAGEIPTCLTKLRRSVSALEKPHSAATSLGAYIPASNMARAAATRILSTHTAGVQPTSAWKRRVKCLGLSPARSAKASTDKS